MTPSTSSPLPCLSVTPELRAYYEALLSAQPSLSSILISSSPQKGRYLRSSVAVSPSSLLFSEPAVLCAFEDPSLCIACHCRHPVVDGKAISCSAYRDYREMRGVFNTVSAMAVEEGYGESRGMMIVDWIVKQQRKREREKEESLKNDKVARSLAASFALPPPVAPTFSFALPDETLTPSLPSSPVSHASSEVLDSSTSSSHSSSSSSVVSSSVASLQSLGFSSIFSLDSGSSSLLSIHSSFASQVWHSLPLSSRRLISLPSLTRLLCILEINAHEMIDEGGEKGEGLFPFFAMIEHNCRENCAFTSLSSSSSSSSPSVSVTCIRPISSSDSLSINYAPPYLPTSLRRSYLEENYHFVCRCDVCEGRMPDKCRAFVCLCGEVVWVWGEGREKENWKCCGCGREAEEEDVRRWKDAEEYVGGEVQRLMKSVEEEAEEGEKENKQNKEKKRKREEQRRKDLSRIDLLVLQIIKKEKHINPTPSVDQSMKAIAEEEGEMEEGEGQAAASIHPLSPSSSLAPFSKSQLKNRRRREKQKAAAAEASKAQLRIDLLSLLHPSHYHVHTLLELLCSFHAEAGEWEKAIMTALQRVENVRRVMAGDSESEVHWLEAVEWSLLGNLYGEKGDDKGRMDSFARCYEINRRCFGEHAASTRFAQSRMK